MTDKLKEQIRATDLKTATDLTRLELESGKDIEGSVV